MTQRSSKNPSKKCSDLFDTNSCIVCDKTAQGIGLSSGYPLCQKHLDVDVEQVMNVKRNVNKELHTYAKSNRAAKFAEEQLKLEGQMAEMEIRYVKMQATLNQLMIRIRDQFTARQHAVQKCLLDLEDMMSYERELKDAEDSGNLKAVCDLAVGMQASLPDLAEDFSVAERWRIEFEGSAELRRLRQLWLVISGGSSEADTADATDSVVKTAVENTSCGMNIYDEVGSVGKAEDAPRSFPFSKNSELKLDHCVDFVTVCTETKMFRGDYSTGRVVPSRLACAGQSVALPHTCLVAAFLGVANLAVLSLDGIVSLKIYCSSINWDSDIEGLHGDRHLVFVAQGEAVTVMDLSGRTIRRIRSDTVGLGNFSGIGGNAASIFVPSGSKIAAFSKATGRLETLITPFLLADADLSSLAVNQNSIFVLDKKHWQVYKVAIDTQKLVALYPTSERVGLIRFEEPLGVAVNSRGHLFVSESSGHTVRAVADNGSLLWTLGVTGESGCGDAKLDEPHGMVVMTGGPCEQLVVADSSNKRLLVMNLS